MSEDRIGYNAMVEEAMRSVVRKAVELAASEGLPAERWPAEGLPKADRRRPFQKNNM